LRQKLKLKQQKKPRDLELKRRQKKQLKLLRL
jgi:hypothetical protein